MLAIRLQRTGRSGHAQFRLIAQDSRFSPTSGRVVAHLGSYDPHTKAIAIDKDKAADYLSKGAQPSPRAAKLLKAEGVKLPSWVAEASPRKRDIRNPEKLRRNRPAGAEAPTKAEAPVAEEAAAAEPATEPSAEPSAEAPAEETAAEPSPEEKPTEEPKTEKSSQSDPPAEEAEPAADKAE